MKKTVSNNIQKIVGLTIPEIQKRSPKEIRKYLSKKNKTFINIESRFPFIGCGNVLRDYLISEKELNHDIDLILRKI